MGATNCPETPRQKMIGMMYLVLTAMLALNVSVEIINAFVTVGDSMEATNRNFSKKIDDSYTIFENAYKGNPEKVGTQWEEAKKVKALTKELIDYIEDIKVELVSKNEGITKEATIDLLKKEGAEGIKKKDNYDIGTNYLVGQSNDGSDGEARKLKIKMQEYKQNLIKILGERARNVNLGLNFEGPFYDMNGKEVSWETKNFFHTVIVADLVILNKYKAEVLNSEFDAVNVLYASVSAGDFKFDNVTAKVVPKATYVLQGSPYEAEIFIAAVDSKSKLEAKIGGRDYIGDTGVINYKVIGSSIGLQRYSGTLYVKNEMEGTKGYDFKGEYYVAPPAVVVSPSNMNVFYLGIENPVDIAVPGASAESVSPQISAGTGASITKTAPGKYIVNVKQAGVAKVEVFANINGQNRSMGIREFRCKRIPNAQPVIGRFTGTNGTISRDELLAADRIQVRIPDFEFNVRLNVKSFVMKVTNSEQKVIRAENVSGGGFTPEMKRLVQGLRRGQRVNIEDISVAKPDGSTEYLSMSLKIQ